MREHRSRYFCINFCTRNGFNWAQFVITRRYASGECTQMNFAQIKRKKKKTFADRSPTIKYTYEWAHKTQILEYTDCRFEQIPRFDVFDANPLPAHIFELVLLNTFAHNEADSRYVRAVHYYYYYHLSGENYARTQILSGKEYMQCNGFAFIRVGSHLPFLSPPRKIHIGQHFVVLGCSAVQPQLPYCDER